jgi:hypothetical protein
LNAIGKRLDTEDHDHAIVYAGIIFVLPRDAKLQETLPIHSYAPQLMRSCILNDVIKQFPDLSVRPQADVDLCEWTTGAGVGVLQHFVGDRFWAN